MNPVWMDAHGIARRYVESMVQEQRATQRRREARQAVASRSLMNRAQRRAAERNDLTSKRTS